MKQIRIILLLILTLAIALTSLTSCDVLEQLGITLPGQSDEPNETPDDTEDQDNKVDPATCGHYVTTVKDKVAATCTAEGYTGDTVCYACGTVVKNGTTTEMLEHNYKNGECTSCGEAAPGVQIPEEWAQYTTITIAEALTLCEQFVDAPSPDRYYIIATVKEVTNTSFGQLQIVDETGEIMVYGTNSADGSLKYDQMGGNLKAGDVVLLYGTLQNYKGNTKEVQNAWLIDYVEGVTVPVEPTITPESTITIEEAIANATLVGETDRFYITATVKSIKNPAYGEMYIVDETGELYVYGSYSADGSIGYSAMEDKPYMGDTVTLYVTLGTHNGTAEIKNAWIVSFTHNEIEVNEDDYTEMTVAEARAAADGTLVKVNGVVARITYANGYVPSGFYLIDGTNSIYVYDGQIAARVKEGNTVTVLASKAHWILDSEQNNANKFGYKGCNQLTNVVRFESDNGNTAFDTSWITESTMKDIIDTPVTTDISTTIYKVNALIKKVVPESGGFVNYYFFDLDGKTGSYAYTQCNGGDFAWLDQFDGKICTVYISALNAKSTASDCYWRFIPVAVSYDNYQFDVSGAPSFVLDYHVKEQFFSKYTSDPALELITSVSSELLGFEGANITYTVDNNTVAQITTENGKVVFHLVEYGTVTVTATATYGEHSASKSFVITYEEPQQYNSVTVEEAINASLSSTVVVQGIVGPSLVNQTGFYLIDETGMIAVTMTESELANFEMGQLVIIQGTRDRKVKVDDNGNPYTCHGQTQLKDCVLLLNLYGDHSYSVDHLATELTIEEFYALDKTKDFTTTVYKVKAYVFVEQYNIKLGTQNGSIKSNLYSSGVGQYSWLKDYNGQELTFYLAPCNWNSKSYYAGCALAAVLADGTVVYNALNFQ